MYLVVGKSPLAILINHGGAVVWDSPVSQHSVYHDLLRFPFDNAHDGRMMELLHDAGYRRAEVRILKGKGRGASARSTGPVAGAPADGRTLSCSRSAISDFVFGVPITDILGILGKVRLHDACQVRPDCLRDKSWAQTSDEQKHDSCHCKNPYSSSCFS